MHVNYTNKTIFFNSCRNRISFWNFILAGTFSVLFNACGPARLTTVENRRSSDELPDYSNLNHWAAHPGKWDFSDSLPRPYRPLQTDTGIDVFFVHPTTYTDEKAVNQKMLIYPEELRRWNASVTDEVVNHSTDKGSVFFQASAFNCFRVFAPRYRQAHIQTFYIEDSIAKVIFELAYKDVRSAFLYYLQNENKGRPFVIASHSQGTLHAARLVKECIEGTPLQEQLVAAYLIGLPVRTDYFSSLDACKTPLETGCILSWRTFKMGYMPGYVNRENFKAIVVNPISWKTDEEQANRNNNKGAVLYNFNKPKPANVSALAKGNILWSTKPRFFGNFLFTRKNYHIGDINLFWKDIRDNVVERVEAYRQKTR